MTLTSKHSIAQPAAPCQVDQVTASSCEEWFLQASNVLDLTELILLGFEYCGSYATLPGSLHGFIMREPLTTVPRLLSHINKCKGRHGIKQARRALSCVIPNSASPGETGIAMLLTMPHMLGGFNLKGPSLNYKVYLGQRAKAMFGKQFYVCDMYWPTHKLAIEYDSDLYHTGSERIAKDSKRRNALLFMGSTVITITRKQVNNFAELNNTANIIASHLGVRLRPRTENFDMRQFALRAAILGGSASRSGQFLRFAGQNLRLEQGEPCLYEDFSTPGL